MKKNFVILGILLTSVVYAENLFKNSDMSQGGGWKGDRAFIEENENRFMLLTAKKNRKVEFSQDFKPKEAGRHKLSFRYKSSDYKGVGFEIRKETNGRPGPFNVIKPKVTGDWVQYQGDVRVGEKEDPTLFITLHPGDGSIAFDDIILEAVK